jgi:hypothetical protein
LDFVLFRVLGEMAHIGDVLHVTHLVPQVPQVPNYHVEADVALPVAEMAMAVHRRAAYIHAHMTLVEGFEDFLLPAKSVVNP